MKIFLMADDTLRSGTWRPRIAATVCGNL